MNPQIQSEKTIETSMFPAVTSDEDELAQLGFTSDEIVSLLYLRQKYQTGGSDRIEVVRYLEFLKLLVVTGRMEL
jgi:hypothetical protein